jgi:spore germination protein KB
MANRKTNNLGGLRVKLSPMMLFILLFVSAMGLSYLIPYQEAAKACGPSVYLAVLVALLLVAPFIFLIAGLQQRFPEENLLGAAAATYGRVGGTLLNLLFLAALVFQIIFGVRNTAELIITYSLSKTPLGAVIALILICSGFFVKDGLVGVSRLAGFVFIPVLLFRILIMLFSLPGIEPSHLLPLISARPLDYLQGGLSLALFFGPASTGLLFIYPLLSKPAKLKSVTGCLLTALALLVFFSVMLVTGIFGDTGLQSYIWPVFEAIRLTDISFLALDQVGLIFLIVWFTAFLTGLALVLYLSGSGLKQQFKNLDYRWCLGGNILVVAAGAVLIPNLFYDLRVFMMISKGVLAFIYLYPLLVYVGALIRGVGVKTP